MQTQPICFIDLDGTVLDVSQKFYMSYVDILTGHGFQPLSKEVYWSLKVNRVVERDIHARSGAEISSFSLTRKQHIETPEYQRYDQVIDGAIEALERLKTKYRLVLVTLRHHRENLMSELEEKRILHNFTNVLSADPASHTTKSFIKTRLIRDEYKQSNLKDAVFIGDTEADIDAGKDIDACCIAVTSGLRTREFLEKLDPDYVVADIQHSLTLLGL